MKSDARSVLVIGAGIIGLASACRLARRGHAVTIFDPSPGRGATWAAAGMIAPSAEILPGEEDNYRLQCGALAGWRALNEELHAVTGRRVRLHETGTLVVGWDAGDRALVKQFAEVALRFAAPFTTRRRAADPTLFAGLSDRVHEGLLMEGDAWLDPDEAVAILREALNILDVELVTEAVVEVGRDEQSVVACAAAGRYRGDVGLLATGWSPLPAGVRASGAHRVRPVHGVTVRVDGIDRSAGPAVRAYVRGRPFYLVSRPGGYCVLGASSEERAGAQVQAGELYRLLRDALDVVPGLETAEVLETRGGQRPASADGRPFLERLEPAGWGWSSGYYRHGVALAPWAAERAVEFVEAS
ncbi:MAG: FAD-dependent oxidoreductase [Acidimicrobiales bacterium]